MDLTEDLTDTAKTSNVKTSSFSDDDVPLAQRKDIKLKMTKIKLPSKENNPRRLKTEDIVLDKNDDLNDMEFKIAFDPEYKPPKKSKTKSKPKFKIKKVCSQCQQQFEDKELWRIHVISSECSSALQKINKMKSPHKSKSWSCTYCPEVFKHRKLLQCHKKSKHPQIEFKDDAPTYTYDESQDLYICSVCSAEFQNQDEANKHVEVHVEKFFCPYCDETFRSLYQLGIHSAMHNEEGKIQCPQCSYSTPKAYSFKAHIKYIHLKKYPYYCFTCGKGFNQLRVYEEHQNIHTGQKPFICVVCSKGFPYSKYLVVHQVRNHQVGTSGQRIENECRRCNRYFYRPEDLAEHQEKCLNAPKRKYHNRIHLCNLCGKNFTAKANLIGHLRVHNGESPFVCTYCGKSFTKPYYLKCHERIHTGEKPYSCEFCGKRFKDHSTFRVHKRIHTGERPYVCTFCNKGFTTNQGLRLHVKNCGENQVNNLVRYVVTVPVSDSAILANRIA